MGGDVYLYSGDNMKKISMKNTSKKELFEISKRLHHENYLLKKENNAMVAELLSFAKVISFYSVNFRPRDELLDDQPDDVDIDINVTTTKKEKDGFEVQ